jgi:arabinogalactan oligomer / maltooligosaccharide transport system permease protein
VSSVTSTASPVSQPVFKPGLISRAVALFSGSTGQAIKIGLLAASNALAAWAAYVLIDHHRWPAVAVLIAATALIDFVYLVPRRWTLPAKFLIPGTVFLLAFQIFPILYTINVAFSNYSTGHILTRSEAIKQIQINSLDQLPNSRQFDMAVARNSSGDLVLLLHDQGKGGKVYVGTTKGLTELPKGSFTLGETGQPASAKGYTLIKGAELFALDQQLGALRVPTSGTSAIQPQGTSTAVELTPTLRYDPKRGVFVRLSDGTVFRDNGLGSFTAGTAALEPGWKTYVGTRNFSKMIHDPLIRKPFLSVFVWTFVFAASVVLISFFIGLFFAIALDKKGLRFQRLYRSALIIPWAIPGFLALLVWAGLLNDDFGVVNNNILHTHIGWLQGGNVIGWLPYITWPRIAVVMVSVWLTVPYFFLVSLGALQSIPEELTEAARVDGGNPRQIFRRVTLPLLLVAVSPLLIASFAFNFNNFNNIYLLTHGGPYNGASSIAGNTDILISYTYKVAIATGTGGNYALASAFAIVIFFLVAAISGFSFLRSKSLEALK